MKRLILLILLITYSYSYVDIPSNKCALIVASRQTLDEVESYINTEIDNKTNVKVYQSNNGWYAISIGLIPKNQATQIISNLKLDNSIPKDSFCANANRFEKEINLDDDILVKDNIDNSMPLQFDYQIKDNKIYIQTSVRNYFKKYYRGGITISFPQFTNKNRVKVINKYGFESVKKYSIYDKAYNNDVKENKYLDYLMVEGWSDNWGYKDKKVLKLVINSNNLDSLIINIRAVLRNSYKTLYIPNDGPYDQQRFHSRKVIIKFRNQHKHDSKKLFRLDYGVNECTKPKPALACSPSEEDSKPLAMCAITMGGCSYITKRIKDKNKKYLVSQACAAYSAKLLEQKYTLNDALGTFIIDAIDQEADEQEQKGADGISIILKVISFSAKLSEFSNCVVKAKSMCKRKYQEWRNCY